MKQRLSFFLLIATAILVSECGNKSGNFRLEGRFRNLNQGEFYIYSLEGGISDIDTIKVTDGRFAYETPLDEAATFTLIFPNFSEQPIFAEPGKTVEIKGDASHLKEMEISGTKDNELMTKLRLRISNMTPPETLQAAAEFVEENPKAAASRYVIQRFFILGQQPDYNRAYELAGQMMKTGSPDIHTERLYNQLKLLKAGTSGMKMPAFSATDIQGKTIGKNNLNAKANVVCTWAQWSWESMRMQQLLRSLKIEHGDQLAVVSICLDADKKKCKQIVERDSIRWPNVCDGRMWHTPLLGQLGLATVPGNIIYDAKGNVVASNLNYDRLREKINAMLQ